MGIKDLVSSVFSKAKPIKVVEEVNSQKRDCKHPCELCGKVIGEDRYKKVQGRWFHKTCYKRQLRKSFNGGGL